MKKTLSIIITILMALFLISNTVSAKKYSFKGMKDFDRSGIESININSESGEIKIIKSEDDNRIRIKYAKIIKAGSEKAAKTAADKIKVELIKDKRGISINANIGFPSKKDLFNILKGDLTRVSVILTVAVPSGLKLNINSNSADISIVDYSGPVDIMGESSDLVMDKHKENVRAKLSSGDVNISNQIGNLDIKGSSSDIALNDIRGDTKIVVSSGDIRIYGLIGSVNAQCSSGDIESSDISGQIIFKTVSGDISAKIRSTDSHQSLAFESSSGDIGIRLKKKCAVDFMVKSSSGDINVNLGDKNTDISTEITESSPKTCSGSYRGGGAKLFARSSSGDISIEEY